MHAPEFVYIFIAVCSVALILADPTAVRVKPGEQVDVQVPSLYSPTLPRWITGDSPPTISGNEAFTTEILEPWLVLPWQGSVMRLRLTAPLHEGFYTLQVSDPSQNNTNVVVEVTCSDGVFCNGIERFVNGSCVRGPNPCDDHVNCTVDMCSEEQV